MFKKSTTNRQIDFLGNVSGNLDTQRAEILNDPEGWYNQFYEHVFCRFDESCFEVLYSSTMGRTNSPIRTLLSMMSLKEGFGWSDKQLYEQIGFNLLVRRALGFENLSDAPPVQSTYYAFKQAVYRYHIEQGRDLIEEAFKALTRSQAEFFDVDGKKIRMDSKLIGSNIVRCSRLQLIISCLQAFWKSLSKEQQERLDDNHRQSLDELCKNKPNQIIFPMSEEEKGQKLIELGELLLHLKRLYDDSDSDKFQLVERILDEQYQIEDDQTKLKPGKDISADSIQSPHDPDAAYRKKSKQTVNGYSINVTETCNDEGPNLIVDIQTEQATQADNDFVKPAVDNAMDVVGPVEQAYMDGAYQSPDNVQYGEAKEIDIVFTGIQGAKGNFEFIKTDDGLLVLDRTTGTTVEAIQYKDNHYKIKLPGGRWRYFKPEQIECFERRKALESLPVEVRNRRNNVEATIFQLSYHSRNNKTKYRGRLKNKIWATCRATWVNLIRIRNYVTKPPEEAVAATT
ncbi:MAG: transposase [Planctomycetes bacterium]|nr:transposase [Planctomycetota bacterium]